MTPPQTLLHRKIIMFRLTMKSFTIGSMLALSAATSVFAQIPK